MIMIENRRLLPLVTMETLDSTYRELIEKAPEYIETVKGENPELYHFMVGLAKGDEKSKGTFIATYIFLRRQAEADELAEGVQ